MLPQCSVTSIVSGYALFIAHGNQDEVERASDILVTMGNEQEAEVAVHVSA